MIELGFEIVRTPYDPRSGMIGEMVQKRRVDGRCGLTVGDEALLWDALQEARAIIADQQSTIALVANQRLAAEKERDELKACARLLQSDPCGDEPEQPAQPQKGRKR